MTSIQQKKPAGHIEVICGPMFAGKSEALFGTLIKYHMADLKVQLFKSTRDSRYGTGDHTDAASHSGRLFPAKAVDSVTEIATAGIDVIGIDEGQFMGEELGRWSHHMASLGKIVIIACLNTNFMMDPFEHVMAVICCAEKVTKLSAVCCVCYQNAHYTRKLTDSKTEIEVGGNDMYIPTCRTHHSTPLDDIDAYFRRVDGLHSLNKSFDLSSSK